MMFSPCSSSPHNFNLQLHVRDGMMVMILCRIGNGYGNGVVWREERRRRVWVLFY
jgi:hypothetical protein